MLVNENFGFFFFFLSDYRDLKRVHGESVQWIVMRRKIWERKYRMIKKKGITIRVENRGGEREQGNVFN
jgi:hypothetical protein